MKKRVRLHRVNGEMIVNIPLGWELPTQYARIYKEGDKLVLEPVFAKSSPQKS